MSSDADFLHLRRSMLRRSIAVIAAVGLSSVAIIGGAMMSAPAHASSVGSHDPFGTVHKIQAVSGGIYVTGWAADPDALTSNLRIYGLVDGRHRAAHTRTSTVWRSVTRKYHTGGTPGFQLRVPVPSGHHTVCIAARHLGAGMDTLLTCFPTPVGRTLSSDKIAQHSPVGAFTGGHAHRSSITVRGWSSDPDYVARRALVVLYVDGRSAATRATSHYAGKRPAGAGGASAFAINVPVSRGTHEGCIWVVNIGLGDNTLLGCKTIDTRRGSSIGSSAPSTSVGARVVREAKRHIGQPYVWGAAGPKRFDCSGLVMYSYGKQGYTTPRVAADQFAAARAIPASRAVPGDLVFYHDSEGHVFHVGIYTGPGMTVAAIDPAEGVDWQSINSYDASYGSFTHT